MPARDILRPLFEYVVTHVHSRDDSTPPSLVATIQTMLVIFISGPLDRDSETTHSYPMPMRRVLQWVASFMCQTPDSKVTLEDLAQISGVCSTHLCRVFHKYANIGPLEFVYVVRITKSLIGLKAGLSVEQLARKFGFTDVSHYSRRFKALFKMTPREMQEAIQHGYRPRLPDLPAMGHTATSISTLPPSNLALGNADGFDLTGLWRGADDGGWGLVPSNTMQTDLNSNSNSYMFLWLKHGEATLYTQGKAYRGVGGDVFLLQPSQVIKWEFDRFEPTGGIVFSFTLGSIPRDWPNQAAWPVKRHMPSNDVLRPLFQYVVGRTPQNYQQLTADLVMVVKAILLTFIHGPLDRVYMFPDSYPQPLRNVLSWIREKLSADPRAKVTLQDIAAVAGVSPVHIIRLFNQHLGLSPLAALTRYRITLSLEMLRHGRKVESVAHDIGFATAAHYATKFKAILGKPPSEAQKDVAAYGTFRQRLDSRSWLDQCEFL